MSNEINISKLSSELEKGNTIRAFGIKTFLQFNELRIRGEEPFDEPADIANTIFRKKVMQYMVDALGITVAAASSHYNTAFKYVREKYPELVDGLGRPADKKGGRKTKLEHELRAILLLKAMEAQ